MSERNGAQHIYADTPFLTAGQLPFAASPDEKIMKFAELGYPAAELWS